MSEERFRLVSRATNDVIKDWNLENNKVWNSESFFSLFSFNPDEVTEHLDFWFSHIHPDDIEEVKKGIFNAINTHQPQWIGEYRFENGKGIYGHVLERGYILQNELGMPFRFISSLMDISALKKAEEATRELLQKKDEFMSIASHELKTPITSMKASIQIVQRIIEEKDSEILALDFIRKANEQVDKLTTLVENLLDVTRIQSGKMAFNRSEFDISELIDECVYHTQNLSRNPILINRNETVHVFADQNRIEQVVMNFLSNAVKYSPDSTEIILNAYEQNGALKVEIKDKGIGIAEENLPYVFDRFFRSISSSEAFSGLGLGLYIAADIIHRHGGKVGVDSHLGNGSTFWFTIPSIFCEKKIVHDKPH